MIRKFGKWVGKSKIAKMGLTIVGAVFVFIGSLRFGTYIGGALLVVGILMEVFNVYSISVITEEARQEIEDNRSEINETYSNMKELSGNIEESKQDLRIIEKSISKHNKQIENTQEEVKDAKDDAVAAKKEVKNIERRIERELHGSGL